MERPTRRVQAGIEQLVALGVEGVFDRALAGANLAPVPGAPTRESPGGRTGPPGDALRAWFAPEVVAEAPGTPDAQPKIAALVGLAREAILQLLRILERRWESRPRSASVAEDFRALAGFFALAAGEGDAYRLFNAAFGPGRRATATSPVPMRRPCPHRRRGRTCRPSCAWGAWQKRRCASAPSPTRAGCGPPASGSRPRPSPAPSICAPGS